MKTEPTDAAPRDDRVYYGICRPLVGPDTITEVEKDPTDQN